MTCLFLASDMLHHVSLVTTSNKKLSAAGEAVYATVSKEHRRTPFLIYWGLFRVSCIGLIDRRYYS